MKPLVQLVRRKPPRTSIERHIMHAVGEYQLMGAFGDEPKNIYDVRDYMNRELPIVYRRHANTHQANEVKIEHDNDGLHVIMRHALTDKDYILCTFKTL